MAQEVFSQVGSGTLPFVRSILSPSQRGIAAGAQGIRGGTQVMIGNPEDVVSVDAFATSGVQVGTNPTLIIGPSTNPLPRCRSVIIHNAGDNAVHLGSSPDTSLSGLPLAGAVASPGADGRRIRLPLLHNVEVWGRTATGTSAVHYIVL